MIPKGLFTQIGMMIVAGAIVVTYIQPEFAGIAEVQDDVSSYETQLNEVVRVNSRLSGFTTTLESVTNADKIKLETYLPNSVDYLSIPRDLFLIAGEAGVLYIDSSYVGVGTQSDSKDRTSPIGHDFTMSVEGTYGQIKTLVSLIEQNHYPLEIHALDISPLNGGFLTAKLSLTTYSYNNEDTAGDKEIIF
jgi:hypothetical protein